MDSSTVGARESRGAEVGQGAPAPLGITTNYSAAPGVDDQAAAAARLARYELQAVARFALPEHRVCYCLMRRLPDTDKVDVLYSAARRQARYSGLMVCGSVWVCAVCAAKISEVRREELSKVVKWWRSQGGQVLMASLTVSHRRGDPLSGLLKRLLGAYQWMCKQRSFQAFRVLAGLDGMVRATEVTWGVLNGWHPHFHILLFVSGDAGRGELEQSLRALWSAAAERSGLAVSGEHGVKLQHTTDTVDKYVTKFGRPWGAEDELAKAMSKRGRRGNMTPFDLLRRVSETGVSWPIELFQEYAEAFHGQRQLVWSRGLKARAGLVDKSDEAIADGNEHEHLWATLVQLRWREFVAVRKANKRGELLEVARTGDAQAVKLFVREILGGAGCGPSFGASPKVAPEAAPPARPGM